MNFLFISCECLYHLLSSITDNDFTYIGGWSRCFVSSSRSRNKSGYIISRILYLKQGMFLEGESFSFFTHHQAIMKLVHQKMAFILLNFKQCKLTSQNLFVRIQVCIQNMKFSSTKHSCLRYLHNMLLISMVHVRIKGLATILKISYSQTMKLILMFQY